MQFPPLRRQCQELSSCSPNRSKELNIPWLFLQNIGYRAVTAKLPGHNSSHMQTSCQPGYFSPCEPTEDGCQHPADPHDSDLPCSTASAPSS